jgi:serine/threonine protein kinase/tetratricopeptide (TPR) repeat protein
MPKSRAQVQPSKSNKDSVVGRAVGRYVVQRRLGAGAMGEVYLAEDPKLKRAVALKRIAPQLREDAEYRARFLKEAERASGVASAYVAAIYDVLEEDGEVFLIMEYVEGRTLRQGLTEPLSVEAFLKIAIQCTQALVSAHGRGILHCDIKPENIMLAQNGDVKVLDFGVAKRRPRSDQTSTMDKGQSGTPAYMAPEMMLNKPIDGRADLFSLGIVFYEMLTGRHPFRSASFAEMIEKTLREKPRSIHTVNPQVPETLEAIVVRMLAKDPTERPANAAELLTDLEATKSQLEKGVTYTSWARTPHFRRKWLFPVTAVVIAATIFCLPMLKKGLKRSGLPATKQLAVLPFLASDSNASTRAFSDGLTETLTTKLASLRGDYALLVVPSSEIRGENVNTAYQARHIFGVNLVLEGSLAQSGGVVRIKYALVDASTLLQIRGDVITEQATDPFGVEDKVVESVLTALDVELGGADQDAVKQRGTRAPVAYDYYLRGIGYLRESEKPENTDHAIEVFQHALQQDPNYALAYAGLGEAYWQKYEHTRDASWVNKAGEACQNAELVGGGLAATHVCLGMVLNGTGEYERAVDEFQRATEIDPANDDAIRELASAYEKLGKTSEAEAAYQRAIELRPKSWLGYNRLGIFQHNQGRYEDAANAFQHVIQLAPDSYRGYSNLGGAYLALGRYSDAIPKFEQSAEIRPTAFCYSNLATAYFYQKRYADAARTYEQAVQLEQTEYSEWGNLAEAYYWAPGKRAEAEETYRKAIALAEAQLRVNPRDAEVLSWVGLYHAMLQERNVSLHYLNEALLVAPRNPEVLFNAAKAENQLGDSQKALDYLKKAVAKGYSRYYAKDDPVFAKLSKDPRFQKLVGSA